MDTTQAEELLRGLDEADPADAADLAIEAARLLSEELERPDREEPA